MRKTGMFDMNLVVNVGGNNTNPKIAILIYVKGCAFSVNSKGEKITLKFNKRKVSADTEDLKFLRGDFVEIAYVQMELEIEKLIKRGIDVDTAVCSVMDEFKVELRILADRAGLEKIEYEKEFNF